MLEFEGRSAECEHGHWAWDRDQKKIGVDEARFRLFGIRIGSEWQGAMTVHREPKSAFLWPLWRKSLHRVLGLGSRPKVVYVDFLEAAPWNYEPFTRPDPPRYRGVGAALVAGAVQLSFDMGLHGRVGLYSLIGAEAFYLRLGFTRLFVDTDPRSATRDCRYFELSPHSAERLLAERNREG